MFLSTAAGYGVLRVLSSDSETLASTGGRRGSCHVERSPRFSAQHPLRWFVGRRGAGMGVNRRGLGCAMGYAKAPVLPEWRAAPMGVSSPRIDTGVAASGGPG